MDPKSRSTASRSLSDSLAFATASSLASLIERREVSAREVLDVHLERIDRLNPGLNALVTLDADRARLRARQADDSLAHGTRLGPLHGVPITLKDTHATKQMRTTAGYPGLATYVPKTDGTVAARLKRAGALLMGKTNTSLLAFGAQTDNPLFGRTNNPWDTGRTPSGSSGGAAAALAAGLTSLDVGSDSGGSIRIPAHFCGVFGFKPTNHRVSRWGHIPDLPGGPTFERILLTSGPMARSLEDLDLAFRLLAGPDGRDVSVAPVPVRAAAERRPAELKVAWVGTFPGVPVEHDIRTELDALVSRMTEAGVRTEEALPRVSFEEQWETWTTLARTWEWLLAHVGEVRELALDAGPTPSLSDFMLALERREGYVRAWDRFFDRWDLLICPPCPIVAYPHCPPGSPLFVNGNEVPYETEAQHCFEFNLSGNPAIVLPLGTDARGLPIGVQLVGRRWRDEELLAAAQSLSRYLPPFRAPPDFA